MKSDRFRQSYRSNASSYHRIIGDLLSGPSSVFSQMRVYQEYPVVRVNPRYPNPAHRYDWVILDLKLIIEVHGEQHFSEGWDGEMGLSVQQSRDQAKRRAAEDINWIYLEVPYHKVRGMTEEKLLAAYTAALGSYRELDTREDLPDRRKELAKQHRRKAYQEMKHRMKAARETL